MTDVNLGSLGVLGLQPWGSGRRWGYLFFWEKQLASLRHFFPPEKVPPPPSFGLRNALLQKSESKILKIAISQEYLGAGWPVNFSPEKGV
ncbi:hypothetical protein [Marinobacter sp. DSM 26671]|uniref:hypothetical protein n=1 Tax=Marinobacter sp. DSM 26671 TaxID=1761793 RepID=UPI0011141DBD|nr:hypothetical protein [Marinobacter sp. DSM 26671]